MKKERKRTGNEDRKEIEKARGRKGKQRKEIPMVIWMEKVGEKRWYGMAKRERIRWVGIG